LKVYLQLKKDFKTQQLRTWFDINFFYEILIIFLIDLIYQSRLYVSVELVRRWLVIDEVVYSLENFDYGWNLFEKRSSS